MKKKSFKENIPANEYCPTAQLLHKDVLIEYVPAAQPLQELKPVDTENEPAEQLMQTDAAAAE